MAAAVAVDAEEGNFVFRVLGQADGLVGRLDGLTIDFLDDVALLETGFGGGVALEAGLASGAVPLIFAHLAL